MSNRLVYYQERMKNAPSNEFLPGNEWDIVDELIHEAPPDLEEILCWIVEKHVGYVMPRE